MLAGYLSCEQRSITQKDPAKITFFNPSLSNPIPIGSDKVTVQMV